MASKRYVIWDKTSDVLTPIGEVLTPEQWIARRPIAGVVTTVVAGGTINGAFFGVYDEMVDYYEKLGCDFSTCTTEQEHLDVIEAFEDAMNAQTGGGTGETVSGTDYDEMAAAIEEGVNEV
jgi:hypothetical protein